MRVGVIAGALCLTISCAASLPTAAHSDTQGTTPAIRVGDRTAEAGQRVRVTGRAPGSAGRTVALEHERGGAWTTLVRGVVGPQGRFRFRLALPGSGLLRATIG